VTLRYVDTSALVRCYFPDEPEHASLEKLLLQSPEPVLTSELTRVELASAVYAAGRAGRIPDPAEVWGLMETDCAPGGPVSLLRLEPDEVFGLAMQLFARFPLRALDAIHLAVAQTTAAELAGHEPIVLISRDDRQRAAAAALGMTLQ
jgi:uncharacterized protein